MAYSATDERPPVALVTGASRGLGRALALFLAGQGFRLVLDARGAEALERSTAAARTRGAEVAALPGDVTDPAHRAALAAAVERAGGRLELLVHNASTLGPTPLPKLLDADPDDLRATFETNLLAPLALTRALRGPLAAAGGRVVIVSSDAARGGYEGWGVYGASKAALELAAATLAAEEREFATVTVDPGDMRTAMHAAAFLGEDISDRPEPEVTLPFFAWLLGQPAAEIDGRRFEAQGRTWQGADGAALEGAAG